ncbi:hypothetical protein [Ferroacidibacillus organovorans]|uniref:hypothetical protein n=1 Tax=Ferroacidibacillus organovorans TaxID=1765683 RepID=UPI0018D34BAA|nr:hypothetical protein [Ferroacidibacillus organovorans]
MRDKIFTIVLLYILFSRFSGLILHPSANLQADLLSLLSGASSSGWLVGLAASVLYALFSFWRAKHLDPHCLAVLAEAICFGSLLFFAYQAYTDLNPFRMEDIFRIIWSAVLIWFVRTRRVKWSDRPQWIWGAYSLVLLLTSAYVPHINRMFLFTTPQWIFVIILLIAVYAEARQDFVASGSVQTIDLNRASTNDGIEGVSKLDTKSDEK